MQILKKPKEMQRLGLQWRREGVRLALVPTMGALHEGHARLIERAHEAGDRVAVSIFVNPAQFAPGEDFAKYPRAFEEDCRRCKALGVDAVFAPAPEAMYPEGFQTEVSVRELARPLCGASRPGHFDGVATVVLKLFTIMQPQAAVFGWKDAQQFILLRRMVRDLNVPVEMIGVETVREADGLALSSRNRYLSAEERRAAPLLYRGLCAARERVEAGERDVGRVLEAARALIESSKSIRLEYLEAVGLDRLEPLERIEPGHALIAVAAHLGRARLIDNVRI